MHLTPHPFLPSELHQNPSSLPPLRITFRSLDNVQLLLKKTAGVKILRTLTSAKAEFIPFVIHPRSFIEVHVFAKIMDCAF